MGRLGKLKRQAINEANLRILGEQSPENKIIGGRPLKPSDDPVSPEGLGRTQVWLDLFSNIFGSGESVSNFKNKPMKERAERFWLSSLVLPGTDEEALEGILQTIETKEEYKDLNFQLFQIGRDWQEMYEKGDDVYGGKGAAINSYEKRFHSNPFDEAVNKFLSLPGIGLVDTQAEYAVKEAKAKMERYKCFNQCDVIGCILEEEGESPTQNNTINNVYQRLGFLENESRCHAG